MSIELDKIDGSITNIDRLLLKDLSKEQLIEKVIEIENKSMKLEIENQQLKQKYEMQKDSNKLLCKAITCDDCDCKVCEAHKENIKYKSVLDGIREQLQKTLEYSDEWHWDAGAIRYHLENIEKILDKVGKE